MVCESYDISVHPSVEHTEKFLEPVDVRDGIYVVYDREGHLLDITVGLVERERHFLWFRWKVHFEGVIISEHEPVCDCSSELRSKLINYLTHCRMSEEELHGLPLEELIRKIGKYMPWHMKNPDF